MPAVRAYMVLAALAEHGESLACRPAPRTTSSGFDGREIDAWLVSDRADAELIAARHAPSPDVADVDGASRPSRRRRRGRGGRGARPRREPAAAPAAAAGRRPRPPPRQARPPRPSASTPSASTS